MFNNTTHFTELWGRLSYMVTIKNTLSLFICLVSPGSAGGDWPLRLKGLSVAAWNGSGTHLNFDISITTLRGNSTIEISVFLASVDSSGHDRGKANARDVCTSVCQPAWLMRTRHHVMSCRSVVKVGPQLTNDSKQSQKNLRNREHFGPWQGRTSEASARSANEAVRV